MHPPTRSFNDAGAWLWRFRPRLFGPVLVYDVVRTARRPQHFLVRGLYGLSLLIVLFVLYAGWTFLRTFSIREIFAGAALDARALADFGASFFLAFLAVQFVAVCLLTPAYTAGALAEDKECKTLEFLFTTDLRSREIVLSVTLSRLAHLLLVILTGLPILALMQLLGGIDPVLLLAGFAATGLSMVALTSLGIFHSVYAQKPRQAILRTYIWAGIYLLISGLSWLVLLPSLGWASWPSTATWTSPVTVEDVVEWLTAGNPMSLAFELWSQVNLGKRLPDVLPPALARCALFNGLLSLLLLVWAVLRLRTVALRETTIRPLRWVIPGTGKRRRPRLGNRPMLWKELFTGGSGRRGRLLRISLGILAPASFIPAVWLLYELCRSTTATWDEFGDYVSLWVRCASSLMACLMLLDVAVRAAGSISDERSRQTLDGLISTRLSSPSILGAKWLGSIAGPRLGWLLLGLIWGIGLFAGALDWRAIPLLVGAWLVNAAFLASLGLWFSVRSPTTQRATVGTLLTAVSLGAGHWLVWLILLPFVSVTASSITPFDWLVELQTLGLSPPVVLAFLAFPQGAFEAWRAADWQWAAAPLLFGLALWGVGAVLLWVEAAARFRLFFDPVSLNPLPAHESQPISTRRLRPLAWRLLVPTLLVLLMAWYVSRDDLPARRLHQAMATADRLDPGWRLDDLEAKRPQIPDDENGALQVPLIPAASMIRTSGSEWWTDVAVRQVLTDLPPQVQLDEQQTRAVADNLEDIESVLIQARRMADYPRGRYPITFAKDGISTMLPHVNRNRLIVAVLGYDARLRVQEGDADGALTCCRGMFNTSESIGDEPHSVSQVVRLACRLEALVIFERILAQGQPSEAALAALQQLLEDQEKDSVLLTAARSDRAVCDRFLGAIGTGDVTWKGIPIADGPYGLHLSFLDRLFLVTGISLAHERAALLDFMTEYVEVAKLPPEQQHPRFADLAGRAGELPMMARSLAARLFSKDGSWGSWLARNIQARRAWMRSAIAAMAAERYRRQEGCWPEALDALVPTFLAEVPMDPYDGKPLRYRRLPDGVVIYALGPAGRDHGGKLQPKVFAPDKKSAGLNVGVRLWDVAQRRQVPGARQPEFPNAGKHPK
jgi:ABC-type Na+ efflux pump permease subunit